jgi:hypothetical protein
VLLGIVGQNEGMVGGENPKSMGNFRGRNTDVVMFHPGAEEGPQRQDVITFFLDIDNCVVQGCTCGKKGPKEGEEDAHA